MPTSKTPDTGRQKDSKKPRSKGQILRQLFFSTLYLSTFTFGGGYVIVSLLKQRFVDKLHWIDDDEMLDLIAIAQSSPGAVAVNGAIVVGYQLAGLPGVLVSTLGAILPPMVILTIVSLFYSLFRENTYVRAVLSGMKAGVSAVIMSVVFDMASGIVKGRDWTLLAVMVIAFLLNYFLKVNVIFLILGTALLGVILYFVRRRGGRNTQQSMDGGQHTDDEPAAGRGKEAKQ